MLKVCQSLYISGMVLSCGKVTFLECPWINAVLNFRSIYWKAWQRLQKTVLYDLIKSYDKQTDIWVRTEYCGNKVKGAGQFPDLFFASRWYLDIFLECQESKWKNLSEGKVEVVDNVILIVFLHWEPTLSHFNKGGRFQGEAWSWKGQGKKTTTTRQQQPCKLVMPGHRWSLNVQNFCLVIKTNCCIWNLACIFIASSTASIFIIIPPN